MKRITIDYILSLGPCRTYTREKLEVMFSGRKWVTPKTVCKEADPDDALWLLLREDFFADWQLRYLTRAFTARVLHIYEEEFPDDDLSRKAMKTARLYACGKATEQELFAATRALADWTTWNTRVALGAATCAVRVAWDAALAVTGPAEREWQVNRIVEELDRRER